MSVVVQHMLVVLAAGTAQNGRGKSGLNKQVLCLEAARCETDVEVRAKEHEQICVSTGNLGWAGLKRNQWVTLLYDQDDGHWIACCAAVHQVAHKALPALRGS